MSSHPVSLFPDSAQLETLLDEEPRLRALARDLLKDPTAADEVVQETLEQSAMQHLPSGRRRRSYVRRVLESRIVNRLRSERRRRHHELRAGRPGVAPAAIDVVAQAEIRRQLIDAVTGLTEPYRSAIWLRYYEDLPPREIAERMDVPVDTVRTRVRTVSTGTSMRSAMSRGGRSS